jgi:hypothetical protein
MVPGNLRQFANDGSNIDGSIRDQVVANPHPALRPLKQPLGHFRFTESQRINDTQVIEE